MTRLRRSIYLNCLLSAGFENRLFGVARYYFANSTKSHTISFAPHRIVGRPSEKVLNFTEIGRIPRMPRILCAESYSQIIHPNNKNSIIVYIFSPRRRWMGGVTNRRRRRQTIDGCACPTCLLRRRRCRWDT